MPLSPQLDSSISHRLLQIKLKRVTAENDKLKDTLQGNKVFVSNASYSIIDYTKASKEPFLAAVSEDALDGLAVKKSLVAQREKNPYWQETRYDESQALQSAEGCCTIM